MDKTVVELFAGVGGFRVGLNNVQLTDKNETIEGKNWDFVWTNQWEPSTKSQPAFECYQTRFGESEKHVNEDISKINKKEIPNHTLLVGGFPCQDYSVARGLSGEKGIQGKKGVLWWEIYNILKVKKPPFVLLENVDRLLKSPSTQRGRDFGIMLRGLADLGYGVEWRVINAAEYGFAQRRRRVFIFAFRKNTNYYKSMKTKSLRSIIYKEGLFSKSFKIDGSYLSKHKDTTGNLTEYEDLFAVSDKFSALFRNSGAMINKQYHSIETLPIKETPIKLKDILQSRVLEKYYIDDKKEEKFKYLKGSKKVPRKRPNGEPYTYSEGAMSFPENLDLPGRTMLTSEGTTNRSTHVVKKSKNSKLRLITPVEAERLNNFPDNWTNTGLTDRQRYFMMGNALVCNVVSKISLQLNNVINNEKNDYKDYTPCQVDSIK